MSFREHPGLSWVQLELRTLCAPVSYSPQQEMRDGGGRTQVMGNMQTQDAHHSLWAPPGFRLLAHLDPRLPSLPPPPPQPLRGACPLL